VMATAMDASPTNVVGRMMPIAWKYWLPSSVRESRPLSEERP
jgi:hypothetical protein